MFVSKCVPKSWKSISFIVCSSANVSKTNVLSILRSKNLIKLFKTFMFLHVFWGLVGIKIEEKMMKTREKMNIFPDPGLRTIFHRFGVGSWVSLGAKMVRKSKKRLNLEAGISIKRLGLDFGGSRSRRDVAAAAAISGTLPEEKPQGWGWSSTSTWNWNSTFGNSSWS